ncbi:MAG TPA: hypothetical protein VN704_08040 [Verrucomicrobiae bacterium]|nr:hypothetical protein [Verrucomicrobiae bacterium]
MMFQFQKLMLVVGDMYHHLLKLVSDHIYLRHLTENCLATNILRSFDMLIPRIFVSDSITTQSQMDSDPILI